MAPSPQDLPPDSAERIGDVLEFGAKAALSVGAIWALIARVFKPLAEWTRKRRALAIRAALAPELAVIAALPEREEKLDLALERQDRVFDEIDLFVTVMADNRERLDEMNDLLNAHGFASRDRRSASERRQFADEAMAELQGRMVARRRKDDQVIRGD